MSATSLIAGSAWSGEQGPAPAQPVLDVDFPDPFVLPTDQGLVAYATNARQRGRGLNVQMSTSSDGRTWSAPVDAMPQTPAWARQRNPDVWAPEVMKIGERYVLYFSARHATRRRPDGLTLCVGAAVSDTPAGPFIPQEQPLTCGGPLGAIDASPFKDGADLWLYVKSDGNCCGVPTTVSAQRLSADGLIADGEPRLMRGVINDAAWEGGVIEAPEMVHHDGRYVLFYSGNDYAGRAYGTGYAVCETATGPCRDAPENPILASTAGLRGVIGPGHASIFSWKGEDWIAYHGWRRMLTDGHWGYRALYVSPLAWTEGAPRIAP